MFNLQGSEIIVILLLALVVLGPEKLPEAVRRFTQTYSELKKMGQGFQSELKSALDEPMREMRETADLIRDSADPQRIAAKASPPPAAPAPAPGDPPLADKPHSPGGPAFHSAAPRTVPVADEVAPEPAPEPAPETAPATAPEPAGDGDDPQAPAPA